MESNNFGYGVIPAKLYTSGEYSQQSSGRSSSILGQAARLGQSQERLDLSKDKADQMEMLPADYMKIKELEDKSKMYYDEARSLYMSNTDVDKSPDPEVQKKINYMLYQSKQIQNVANSLKPAMKQRLKNFEISIKDTKDFGESLALQKIGNSFIPVKSDGMGSHVNLNSLLLSTLNTSGIDDNYQIRDIGTLPPGVATNYARSFSDFVDERFTKARTNTTKELADNEDQSLVNIKTYIETGNDEALAAAADAMIPAMTDKEKADRSSMMVSSLGMDDKGKMYFGFDNLGQGYGIELTKEEQGVMEKVVRDGMMGLNENKDLGIYERLESKFAKEYIKNQINQYRITGVSGARGTGKTPKDAYDEIGGLSEFSAIKANRNIQGTGKQPIGSTPLLVYKKGSIVVDRTNPAYRRWTITNASETKDFNQAAEARFLTNPITPQEMTNGNYFYSSTGMPYSTSIFKPEYGVSVIGITGEVREVPRPAPRNFVQNGVTMYALPGAETLNPRLNTQDDKEPGIRPVTDLTMRVRIAIPTDKFPAFIKDMEAVTDSKFEFDQTKGTFSEGYKTYINEDAKRKAVAYTFGTIDLPVNEESIDNFGNSAFVKGKTDLNQLLEATRKSKLAKQNQQDQNILNAANLSNDSNNNRNGTEQPENTNIRLSSVLSRKKINR